MPTMRHGAAASMFNRVRLLATTSFAALLVSASADAATFAVTTALDSGPGSLRQAITDQNLAGGTNTIVFSQGIGTITLASALPIITNSVTIVGNVGNGNGVTIDGANANRIFLVGNGTDAVTVSIQSLTLNNGAAVGGAGGSGTRGGGGGGGGLGAGGAVFVAANANVSLVGVSIPTASATGGAGGATIGGGSVTTGGGGGGLGGAGGNGSVGGGGGGGGGQLSTQPGGNGNGTTGGGGGGTGGAGGNAGAGGQAGGQGGGGGGNGASGPGGQTSAFGGGGGGGTNVGTGGAGGFGGGGGGAGTSTAGAGGFGAGAGVKSSGGSGGGGGAALGGAIFVQQGGTLTIQDGFTQTTANVTGGAGGPGAGSGSTFGSGLFLQGNGTITFAPSAGTVQTMAGDIADQTGSGGTGANAGSYGLTKTGAGTLTLGGANTYTGGTIFAGGILNVGSAGALGTVGSLSFTGGTLQYSAANQTDYSGRFSQAAGQLYKIDTNAQAVTFATALTSQGGSLTKLGAGTLTLTAANTYSGGTTVNGGTLQLGSATALPSSGPVAVGSGANLNLNGFDTTFGALSGAGTVSGANSTIGAGGTFTPGNGTAGSSMSIVGNLAFASAAKYLVQVNPTTASFATVTGAATLGGATVSAVFANGSYVARQYTILTATGGVSGTFGSLTNANLPTNFSDTLSYDRTHAFLNLTLNFSGPNFGSGLNINQQAVANALSGFFNATGGIPLAFGALTPAGLTQVSGELATGSQQAAFDAMNMFMGLMTDPFVAGRSDGFGASGGAPTGYASTQSTGAARDANAMFVKAPVVPFEARWSVWSAGFGGSQTTDGNAIVGSNSTTSSIYGTAVGADYRISPNTLAGFALAGGGTNFSVAGSGSGHSDLFQAGSFIRHTVGPAYISAALAYGWQDITTNRTVTAAGSDQLRAQFDANAFSGRLEGGYRFVAPWVGGIGITPYAAAQFVTFDLPAYAESALSGASTFALAYNAKDVTDTRSELGIRTDKSWAMTDGILTLLGRLAWAHDYDPNRSIASTFQSLPGASFVVNGAAQAADSALVTASIEKKWLSGWSAAATFEGEFSDVTRSYAGKGVVRYTW